MSKPFASTCYKAWFLVIAACVALLEPALAQNNPAQTALLRWYGDINGSSFAAGSNPIAVAFDGSSIWVASYNGFKVTKLRASDGARKSADQTSCHTHSNTRRKLCLYAI